MRHLWIPASLLLIPASLVGPQWVYYVTDGSFLLALLAGLVPVAALGAVLLFRAPTVASAGVALFIVAGLPVAFAAAGTETFQLALKIDGGRALDGVPLEEVLARGEEGTWVRITDARVRSEAKESFSFTTGGGQNADGSLRPTSHSSAAVAPVTLASDVSSEEGYLRRKPVGEVLLWACAPDIWRLNTWDEERQAVRGMLARMEPHVAKALDAKLRPNRRIPSPGAGAIPPAPGAHPRPRPVIAVQEAALTVAPNAWCVHLDHALDANAARESAWGTLLAFLLMLPLFTTGLLAVVLASGASSKETAR